MGNVKLIESDSPVPVSYRNSPSGGHTVAEVLMGYWFL